MTDLEWLDAVDQYAIQFGHYVFSEADAERLKPFLFGRNFEWVVRRVRNGPYQAGLAMVIFVTTEARKNMVKAVTRKLTQ